MKAILFFFVTAMSISMISCRAGKGCPTNGKNVGAEKLIGGDLKAIKAAKKAGKFRS